MTSRLSDVLARLGRPRVLVAGDLLLDRFLEGDVSRISPEAPIQILDVRKEEERPGGAANVARNVAALGGRAACAGVVGDDAAGRSLRRLLRRAGIDGRAVVTDRGRPTPVKSRMIAHAQQVLRVDRERAAPAAPAVERALVSAVRRLGGGWDLAILSDYQKGTLTPAGVRALAAHFRRRRIPVLAGLKRLPFDHYRGILGVTLNAAELGHAAGAPVRTDAEAERAARALARSLGVGFVLVTRGERGMLCVPRTGRAESVAARAREVYDVTGAGDTVLAALGVALAGGAALPDAVRIANAAAGIVVGKLGTEVVARAELAEGLAEGPAPASRKVVNARTLAARLADHRARGERVVFTNGCFDLLHPGHVATLAFARAQGDRLVVGLNSDRSVRRLKGPGRPVQPQPARAQVLAALEAVDYVVVFDEPTPARLIRAVRPDVLIKGADWGSKGVVGREFVESYGGKVVLAPVLAGHSTTALTERMAGKSKRPTLKTE